MVVLTALLAHQRDVDVSHQVDELRHCVNVLFAFQRRPTKDHVFVNDTRQWLARLVRLFLVFFVTSSSRVLSYCVSDTCAVSC